MASEPVARIHVLEDAGFLTDDSVFDIDGQVARELVSYGLAEIVDAESNPVDIRPGPAGIGTPTARIYQPA
jgi:hypothetical protein